MNKRQKYSKEFKHDAVRLVTEQGYSMAEAARNLGINYNMLGRWKRESEEQEGERKRTIDNVSKAWTMTSKAGPHHCSVMSSGETCLLPERCPA